MEFYSDELRYLRNFLQGMDIHDTSSVTPTRLRQYLLHLGSSRNPGGIHAAYRAMRAFRR